MNNYADVDIYVAWLDGFLKGLAVIDGGADCSTINALKLNLAGDPVKEYLAFVNDFDDEIDESNSSKLSFSARDSVSSWERKIESHVDRILANSQKKSVATVMHQVLDIMSAILEEGTVESVFSCNASMGSCNGEYIFIQVGEREYLILGFLYESKKAVSNV